MIEWTTLARPLLSLLPAVDEWWRQRRGPDVSVNEYPLSYMRHWEVITPIAVRITDGPPQLHGIELRSWFIRNRDAVAATDTFLNLEITGQSKAVTRVEAIEALIIEREAPFTGSHIIHEPAGAGQVEQIFLDLDDPQAGALLDQWPDDQPPSRTYFRTKSIQLGKQESLTVMIRAGTDLSSLTWRLRVLYRVGKRKTSEWVSQEVWQTSATTAASSKYTWRWWEKPNELIPWGRDI